MTLYVHRSVTHVNIVKLIPFRVIKFILPFMTRLNHLFLVNLL